MTVDLLDYAFDDNGNPVAATVQAVGRGPGGTFNTTANAATGQWSLPGLPNDIYDITATFLGRVIKRKGDIKVQIGAFVDGAGALPVGDGTITSAKLAAGAVTSPKLAAQAVGTAALADGAVTAVKLGALAVGTAALAANAVTSAKIAPGAVGTVQVADGAITAAKLGADVVMGGGGGGGAVADNSVTTAAIQDGAVTAAKIAPNSITANELAAQSVGVSEIGPSAVGTSKIQSSAITTALISDRNVTSQKIAIGGVTATELGTDAVTQIKVANAAIGTAELIDGSVSQVKLASGVGVKNDYGINNGPGADTLLSTSSTAATVLTQVTAMPAGTYLVVAHFTADFRTVGTETYLQLVTDGSADLTVVGKAKGQTGDWHSITMSWISPITADGGAFQIRGFSLASGVYCKLQSARLSAVKLY